MLFLVEQEVIKFKPLTIYQRVVKRLFDLFFSFLIIFIFFIPTLFLIVISTIDTGLFGVFTQTRIGQYGRKFSLYKIRTHNKENQITCFGNLIRKLKCDELLQFFNILSGDMSLVGPRPDLPGFADKLQGEDKIILFVKPGITGPASIKFFYETNILSKVENPLKFNRDIIWPQKVEINKNYVLNYSFFSDLNFFLVTLKKTIFNSIKLLLSHKI
ncbi:MAG: sugar transferase [Polaribacter sp.]